MNESSPSRVSRSPVDATDRGVARESLRAIRSRLSGSTRIDADRAIRARLETEVAKAWPAVLAAYWPMRDEPDIRDSLARWHAAGIVVVLPRVAVRAQPLEFGRWTPAAVLIDGPFGTRHPASVESLVPDLLVVPCVGFDLRCHRLGYGGGYYDRTLATLARARAIGVAYDACEVVGFDAQPHDRALDAMVTERRVLLRQAAR